MNTISILQIIVAAFLIVLILLQQRDANISGFLGGSGGGDGGFYQQRRGLERLFFALTIILTVAFAALALTNIFYHGSSTIDGFQDNATSTTSDITASTDSPVINILPPSSTEAN